MSAIAEQHRRVWAAIDRLAENNDISVSRLAIRSGLDSTAFNRSKRVRDDGSLRWPSTETIALVLSTVRRDFTYFAKLVDGRP